MRRTCAAAPIAPGRRDPPLRLLALPAVKASFQQMHRRIWRTADRSQVDAAWRPAARAFYLKPWKPTVDGLADRRRGLRGPSLHIFSFQLWHERLSASRISASPTRRFSSERSARLEYPSLHGTSQVPCSGPSGHRRPMVSGDVSGPWLKPTRRLADQPPALTPRAPGSPPARPPA
jgi:hypothetical protein